MAKLQIQLDVPHCSEVKYLFSSPLITLHIRTWIYYLHECHSDCQQLPSRSSARGRFELYISGQISQSRGYDTRLAAWKSGNYILEWGVEDWWLKRQTPNTPSPGKSFVKQAKLSEAKLMSCSNYLDWSVWIWYADVFTQSPLENCLPSKNAVHRLFTGWMRGLIQKGLWKCSICRAGY